MKISVFGAGAIGSYIAGLLAQGTFNPALIARGETLAAISSRGLIIERPNSQTFTVSMIATDDTGALGAQDILILATKAHQIKDALATIKPLVDEKTLIVPAINGVPWWYCKGLQGALADRDLKSVDPSGEIDAALPAAQICGMVLYLATHIPEPGHVVSVGPQKLIVGAAHPAASKDIIARVATLQSALNACGFVCDIADDIRAAVWTKLWGNIHANPLSVVTGATVIELLNDQKMRSVSRHLMEEAAEVANALGVSFDVSIDQRLLEAEKLGAFRSSMLQDYDKGRRIELDAIVGAVAELAQLLQIATPTIDTVYAITKLRAKLQGLYSPPR